MYGLFGNDRLRPTNFWNAIWILRKSNFLHLIRLKYWRISRHLLLLKHMVIVIWSFSHETSRDRPLWVVLLLLRCFSTEYKLFIWNKRLRRFRVWVHQEHKLSYIHSRSTVSWLHHYSLACAWLIFRLFLWLIYSNYILSNIIIVSPLIFLARFNFFAFIIIELAKKPFQVKLYRRCLLFFIFYFDNIIYMY